MHQLLDHTSFNDQYSTIAVIRRLLAEHAFRYWKSYVVAFVLMGIAAAATAVSAFLLGSVVNEAYVNKNFPAIAVLCGVTIVLFGLKGLATYGQAVMLARISNRIVAANQERIVDKLLNEDLEFFSERHSSDFIARLAAGAGAASQVLNLLITAVGRDFLSLLGLAAVMVVQDPWMSLVGLGVVPPAMLFLRKVVRRVRGIAHKQFTGGARILQTMQELIQGIRIVKAFTLEETMRQRIVANVHDVEAASNKMARVANRSSPLMESLGGIAVAGALLYGGYRVINTGASPGEFVSFMAAFLLAYEPAKRLARLNIELNNGIVGVRILFDLIDSPPREPINEDKPPLAVGTGRIEFSNVSFSYRPDEPVLRDLSFMAEPGKVTALVGPSGGGKSTALALILRFYRYSNGSITIDGQDITTVSRRSLRQQIAYMGQDVLLFHGSIRDNIAFGRESATEDEIVAAAKAAHAHDFIMSFPQGYDTPVGERGAHLSGGQRQRIAIARALIKNAHIILLDEPTASLDSESERQVQDAVAHLTAGRTTLVVAHRLHTIMHADRIHVVENGTIVESGRHDELLRKNGRYASFYRLQLQGQTEDEVAPRSAVR